MSKYKFGFIGCGNMGGSLAKAIAKNVGSSSICLADKAEIKAQVLANELRCSFGNTVEVANNSEFIFLGVKPQVMKSALEEIAPVLALRSDRFVLVSMAAGVKIEEITAMLGAGYPIIRIMPNTPVSVNKGMILYAHNKNVFMDEIGEFVKALSLAGRLDNLDESLIDAATAVSGCGPAFVYMFAESLADAGVECGLPRQKALEYAAQTLSGAAELLLSSGKHPAILKDEVCSPAGSTVAGVHALESNGFRGAVMEGVISAFNKTKKL